MMQEISANLSIMPDGRGYISDQDRWGIVHSRQFVVFHSVLIDLMYHTYPGNNILLIFGNILLIQYVLQFTIF